jgi:predicted nucleotidyltransferase
MTASVPLPGQEQELYDEIVRRIVAVADPERVIVFGSRARGDHRPDSDIDILVIKESSEPRWVRARGLYGALASLPIEVDVLVYTPQEVHEWSEVEEAFVTTATREGVVLYERAA